MGEVQLEEYNDLDSASFLLDELEYPFVTIEGITSNEEIEFFRKRGVKTESSIQAYFIANGEPISLGYFDLVLKNLLAISGIFDYGLILHKSKEESIRIDLKDADTLIKFIKL